MDPATATIVLKIILATLYEMGTIGAFGTRVNELFTKTRAEGRDPTMDELLELANDTDAILDATDAKLAAAERRG